MNQKDIGKIHYGSIQNLKINLDPLELIQQNHFNLTD
jgi:hypothetical protein